MEAYIKAISYYLPENKLTNEQLNEEFPEWSVDKISEKTGIYSRPISANNEFSSDLGYKSAMKLFQEHSISPLNIDFLIFCTQSPDYFLPTTACILQNRLGLPKGSGAFDFNLGCSGFVYGLAVAKGLIVSNIARNILLITAETYTKFIHPKDKSNRTIFGDGAAATLISSESGLCTINEFSLGTDGSGAGNLMVKNGGIRFKELAGADKYDENGFIGNENNLYMNGGEIFAFTSLVVPSLVEDILKKNFLQKENINLFVFHQANKFMLNFIRKRIGIPEEKFYFFLENCGNTVSSTIPIALSEAMNTNKIQNCHKVLIAGFGVGYSWGGTVLNFNK